MIGNAFEDLEALMASAKEIVDLAERFSRKVNGNSTEATSVATQLGLVTTKDIAGTSESLYLSELARTVAEFLTDDSRGVLKKAGGVISLVDLWAMFNRARGGVELVSPTDFEMAARLFHKLKLPVRLRTFKSGVLVVQGKDRTDDSIIRALLEWLDDLHQFPPDKEVSWDWHEFGRGVTAQDAAERFGWSIGVAEEELDMAEQKGVLCREESIEGLKYWKNYIGSLQAPASEAEQIEQALKLIGII
ncbi:Vacuolar protein sorting-associated protein 36 [Ceratocystis platani]|uniref:Vacuolar protein-sorting-associated protein 36 n=2 Tax=Ceratocystis TaxID=5157 RepID=A0A0F8D9E9_CERFI|nr:Vacuolar protein sorting-associated protein 36 [Ceratocystis platani]